MAFESQMVTKIKCKCHESTKNSHDSWNLMLFTRCFAAAQQFYDYRKGSRYQYGIFGVESQTSVVRTSLPRNVSSGVERGETAVLAG